MYRTKSIRISVFDYFRSERNADVRPPYALLCFAISYPQDSDCSNASRRKYRRFTMNARKGDKQWAIVTGKKGNRRSQSSRRNLLLQFLLATPDRNSKKRDVERGDSRRKDQARQRVANPAVALHAQVFHPQIRLRAQRGGAALVRRGTFDQDQGTIGDGGHGGEVFVNDHRRDPGLLDLADDAPDLA